MSIIVGAGDGDGGGGSPGPVPQSLVAEHSELLGHLTKGPPDHLTILHPGGGACWEATTACGLRKNNHLRSTGQTIRGVRDLR